MAPPPLAGVSSAEAGVLTELAERVTVLANNLTGQILEEDLAENASSSAEAYVAECPGEAAADTSIVNLTLVNVLIIIVLILTLAANTNEGIRLGSQQQM